MRSDDGRQAPSGDPREAARDAGRVAEERYRLFAEYASDIVYQLSPDGVVEWVSASMARILGWDPDEFVGTRPWELVHPDDRSAAGAALADSVTTGQAPRSFHCRVRHHDGSYRWMEFSGHSIVVDGVVTGLLASMRDVTTEHEAVAALAEREARYRMLVDNSADVVVHHVDGIVEWVSPAIEGMVGWTAAEAIGATTASLWHPDDRAAAVALGEAVYAGDSGHGVFRFRAKDDHYVWLELALRPTGEGVHGGCVGTLRDVTAQVEAEQALHRSEERFRLLAGNAADVVYLSGPDRRVQWIAPTVERVLGWTADELIGTDIADLIHPDDWRDLESTREAVYDGRDEPGPAGAYVVRLRCKDGSYRWVSGEPARVRGDSGEVLGVVAGLRDVDDLVRARQDAEQDRIRLQATMDSLLDPHLFLDAFRDDAGDVVDFVCRDANTAACAYLRLPRDRIVGHLITTAPEVAASGLLRLLIGTVSTGAPLVRDDFVFRNPDAHREPQHFDFRGVQVGDGLSLTWRDVTDRQVVVDALEVSEEQYRLLAENSTDMVVRVRDGMVLWVSPSVADALGWSPDELVGRFGAMLFHPDDVARATAEEARVMTGGRSVARLRMRAKDGAYHWVESHARPYVGAFGEVDGLVVSAHVVDEAVAAEDELEWRVGHDALTGLVSRQDALDHLAMISGFARRAGDECAVVFCDLDDFKAINDTYGHAAGDDVLRTFAHRIGAAVRTGDVVARFGGDEILIVLDGVSDLDHAVAVAEGVRRDVSSPVHVGDLTILATLSIGVTVAEPGEGVDAMVNRADRAMYEAKRSGHDRVIALEAAAPGGGYDQ